MRLYRLITLLLSMILTGCSNHRIDTFPEWCEQISGVDLEAKYRPFWAVIFSISFDGTAVRDDYVKFLDKALREKVGGRADRMVWREGAELHMINLSALLVVEPDEIITGWRKGISDDIANRLKDPADLCLYGTLTSMFDNLHIHSMEADSLGLHWTDNVTVISTERKQRLGEGCPLASFCAISLARDIL